MRPFYDLVLPYCGPSKRIEARGYRPRPPCERIDSLHIPIAYSGSPSMAINVNEEGYTDREELWFANLVTANADPTLSASSVRQTQWRKSSFVDPRLPRAAPETIAPARRFPWPAQCDPTTRPVDTKLERLWRSPARLITAKSACIKGGASIRLAKNEQIRTSRWLHLVALRRLF